MTVQINGTNGIQFPDGINLNIDKLFSANGYQKLPGGLILQWGSGNTVSGVVAVNFPIAFPNGVLKVLTNDVAVSTATLGITGCDNGTLTGFNAYAIGTSGTGISTEFKWFAIGY